jgi:hypothetical protein
MDNVFENAQRIFDVAMSGGNGDNSDFALLIRPDGGLHFVMESPFSIDAAAIHAGAQSAYRITRSSHRVRVQGRSFGRDCVLEQQLTGAKVSRELLSDQALYRITSPLLTS